MYRPDVNSQRAGMLAAWAIAWVLTAWLIAVAHYGSRDPDSQLYAGISARLVSEPASQWIAPEWWGLWNTKGPYCEHPVGMFLVPAVLGRAGYPPEQAAYAVTAFYQIATFAMVALLGSAVVQRRDAMALAALLQVLPIAFVFRIRANQEYAVLAGLLFAVYSTERARSNRLWTSGMLGGFCAVLLIKGVFAFMVPVACGLWLIARSARATPSRRDVPAWLALAAMPVVGAAVAWGYEAAYWHVTGRSFLAIYRSRQLPEDALVPGSLLVRMLYTATWYLVRILWYAFPWSVAAAAVAAGGLRRQLWRPWGPEADRAPAGWQGAWFAIGTGFALTAAFSLAHRKADRYIFPVYFLIGAAGAGGALHRFRRLGTLACRLDRPWVPAAVYLLLVLLTMITSGRLPQFTFWRT